MGVRLGKVSTVQVNSARMFGIASIQLEVCMVAEKIRVGQRFRWSGSDEGRSDDGSSSGTAIVKEVRSDQQEGMSPEVEQYAALWIEAEGRSGMRAGQRFTIVLGTDGKSYLDGKPVAITLSD